MATTSNAQIKYSSLFNSIPINLSNYQVNSDDEIVTIVSNGMIYYTEKDAQGWKSPSSIFPYVKSLGAVNRLGNTIIAPVLKDNGGELYRSTDFGKTWKSILKGENKNHVFVGTQMFTEQKFILYGRKTVSSLLQKTEDGGATWVDIPTPELSSTLGTVNFITEQVGFLIDMSNKYFKTNDGGITWSEFITFPDNTTAFQFSSIDKGIALTGNQELFETSDGGVTWNSRLNYIYNAQIVKGDTLIATSNSQKKFYYTTDRFVTKTEKEFVEFDEVPEILKVINDSTFVGKKHNNFFKTTDRGQNWTSIIDKSTVLFKPSIFTWINDTLGYAFSGDGVYKTTTGGFNWEATGTSSPIGGIVEKLISFGDSDYGIAFHNSGNDLYRTSNGGKSWARISHSIGDNYYNRELTMISASKGWLLSRAGLAQTADSGKTWTSMYDKIPADIKKNYLETIDFLSETHGIIGGEDGWVAITSDGGTTWTSKQIGSKSNDIHLVHYFSEQVIIAVYTSGVFRSEDGGVTWESSTLSASENIYLEPRSKTFLNEKVGAFLTTKSLVYTVDAGKTWSIESAPIFPGSILGLYLNRDGRGVFYSGAFVSFELGELTTSIEEEIPPTKREFQLAQNYPNPFNPTTTISFTLKQFDSVSLSVYSVDGRLVSTLMSNENLSSGSHQVVFDAKSLASGVYFYQLKTSQGILSQKMTLIK